MREDQRTFPHLLYDVADTFEELVQTIDRAMITGGFGEEEAGRLVALRRAKAAAEKGATLARRGLPSFEGVRTATRSR